MRVGCFLFSEALRLAFGWVDSAVPLVFAFAFAFGFAFAFPLAGGFFYSELWVGSSLWTSYSHSSLTYLDVAVPTLGVV